MSGCIGVFLVLSIVLGGTYLYFKVERLDREIARQKEDAVLEAEDDAN
jgi:hypothetical protein